LHPASCFRTLPTHMRAYRCPSAAALPRQRRGSVTRVARGGGGGLCGGARARGRARVAPPPRRRPARCSAELAPGLQARTGRARRARMRAHAAPSRAARGAQPASCASSRAGSWGPPERPGAALAAVSTHAPPAPRPRAQSRRREPRGAAACHVAVSWRRSSSRCCGRSSVGCERVRRWGRPPARARRYRVRRGGGVARLRTYTLHTTPLPRRAPRRAQSERGVARETGLHSRCGNSTARRGAAQRSTTTPSRRPRPRRGSRRPRPRRSPAPAPHERLGAPRARA